MTAPGRERRAHKRFELACPIVVADGEGRELLRTQTLNISDGGAFLASQAERTFQPGQPVGLALRVPRSTPNTYMLEDVATDAHVTRCQGVGQAGGSAGGVAVRFAKPLDLKLEV